MPLFGESVWAYLPAGPLERLFGRDSRGDWREEVLTGTLRRKRCLSWVGHIRGSLCLLLNEMHASEKGLLIFFRDCFFSGDRS
jgi:hypothetical protein